MTALTAAIIYIGGDKMECLCVRARGGGDMFATQQWHGGVMKALILVTADTKIAPCHLIASDKQWSSRRITTTPNGHGGDNKRGGKKQQQLLWRKRTQVPLGHRMECTMSTFAIDATAIRWSVRRLKAEGKNPSEVKKKCSLSALAVTTWHVFQVPTLLNLPFVPVV